jgi:hypothetical protein
MPTQPEKTTWEVIPISGITNPKQRRIAIRLNCFGSAYYFIKIGLEKSRLYDPLHGYMASLIEKQHLKEVIEIPRDHFKSTIFSEGAPLWWSLPFGDDDEAYMRRLGYGDAWIRWMKWVHNRDNRTLIVSENDENVAKLGRRYDNAYKNNVTFRWLFPEVIPDSSCSWGANSKTHKRSKKSPDGEGTFDFLSVGMALQSRHYDRVIEDDLVGMSAKNSEATIKTVIEYHRLLPGAFDSKPELAKAENDEIVVGNRWSYSDLNSWIRENEPWFTVHSHSAIGGCCNHFKNKENPVDPNCYCCKNHPLGKVIFPLEWSHEKLRQYATRFGLYDYSCQFLNDPVAPGVALFQEEWLRYYKLVRFNPVIGYDGQPVDPRAAIQHEVKSGEVIQDQLLQELPLFMIVDPNHAGNSGRCRHAITITAVQNFKVRDNTRQVVIPRRIYLIEAWAEACNYHEFVRKIYELADKYKLNRFWLEVVGGQRYLKFYLDERNKLENRKLTVMPLKVDTSANAKRKRIDALNPFFAEGQVFVRREAHFNFIEEYKKYPNGKTLDILDTLSYGPEVWDGRVTTRSDIERFMQRQQASNPWENANYAGY